MLWRLLSEVLQEEGGKKQKKTTPFAPKKKKKIEGFRNWYRIVLFCSPASFGGTGNSERMSRHHGVCTCAMTASLHRHDVLDKGCSRRTGQRGKKKPMLTRRLHFKAPGTVGLWRLTLIVDTAVLILLSGHESVDLSLIHLLSCRGRQRTVLLPYTSQMHRHTHFRPDSPSVDSTIRSSAPITVPLPSLSKTRRPST